jgi:crotonobetainyl-CoA:carnitine CoA-transferase CaiB-like acyl-CoA transferase
MRKCQAAGIVAAVVQNAEDRVEYDPQLQHREVFPIIENPEVGGAFAYEGYPVRLSRTPANVQTRAPMLSEHNQYVFGELLGMSESQIHSLRARGVI